MIVAMSLWFVVGFWDLELPSNVWGFQVLMMIPTCNNGFLWCLERNVLPNNLVVDKWQHLQLAQRCWWILACYIVVEQTLEMVQDVGCSTWTLVLWKLSTCPEIPPKINDCSMEHDIMENGISPRLQGLTVSVEKYVHVPLNRTATGGMLSTIQHASFHVSWSFSMYVYFHTGDKSNFCRCLSPTSLINSFRCQGHGRKLVIQTMDLLIAFTIP